ncbi:MAG: phosphoribosylformylglycinamidine synthase subunit PurL [Planctomycetes bacterium]|nr:phosphoribosylformylglycinamidine synthase subunit PurL [Planctomycetota bacterium]
MTTNTVFRVEVRPKAGQADPIGEAARQRAMSLDLPSKPTKIDSAAIYLIQGNIDQQQLEMLADQLLADVVIDSATFGSAELIGESLIEVHPLPGVMDPDAEVIELAIRSILGVDVQVRTGKRYDMHGIDSQTAQLVARSCLANPVVHAIHNQPYHPQAFPKTSPYELRVVSVPLLEMGDKALTSFSREAHLFLSLEEMQEIQAHYKKLGRDPHDIELETLAQTWSEHCVHKTLKATIRYCEDDSSAPIDMSNRPGHVVNDDGSVTINNLLKSTIAAATKELMADGIDWCLSVFVDNAGIIAFDDETAVCFKVETHNHPSAIEPYGGAATGIGGCIRDIIGTGLAAKPIAATDVFCVGYPDHFTAENLPTGCLHPKRILTEIVSGVRDYGNRMGIPTIDGAVWFDNDYVGNPLVYCGCVGVMPRDKVTGDPNPGDRIIALGGRTGRDGIHGATFSSSELTDVHADEFSHAVQIGNPVTEKKMLDAILQARDHEDGCLFTSITDCGAGGFSSAVGEMGEQLGAQVNLEQAPLKYDGLSPTEIWISEAQERMVLAVEQDNIEKLQAICDLHDVQMCDLGEFGTVDRELILLYEGTEVGRLSMAFLHDGLPKTTRQATWSYSVSPTSVSKTKPSITEALLKLIAHPNIASKHWIIRQYDHEVQGSSVVTPLVGANSDGPSDASVIVPVLNSTRGLAIGNGLATGLRDDPYQMAIAAVDECVRNLVCVGADPKRIAILDNFCWPSCDNPAELGGLVRAAEGCYDAAKAYRTPFISGKDSLNNQFATDDGKTIKIPPTLLISGMGIVPDINKCVTMDIKSAGSILIIVGETQDTLGGSHYARMFGCDDQSVPIVDLKAGPRYANAIHSLINNCLVDSVHDCSDGGLLVAIAEMCIAGRIGASLECSETSLFSESPSRYVLEVSSSNIDAVKTTLADMPFVIIGETRNEQTLRIDDKECVWTLESLSAAWRGTLDW